MKMLILTPINPVDAGMAYSIIANHLQEKENVEVLSIPVFAEIHAQMEGKEYIPGFFAMLKGSEEVNTKNKLYQKEHTIVVGNIYKSHKFDYIISLDYDDEDLPFDPYIAELDTTEFAKLVRVNDLYKPEDAEFNVPTVDHAIKFIEEAIKNNEQNRIKRKTTKGS